MHPILFKLGWFEVHTYGLLLMISFLAGIYLSSKFYEKEGVDPNVAVDLGIVIIITSLIGARLLYVMFHFDEYSDNLFDIINPVQSDGTFGIAGLSILGGVITACVGSYIYLNKKKLAIMKIFNLTAPTVALGVGITRIGCFFHGCCFGEQCELPIGVIFPANSPAGSLFPGTPIYPTQLFASAGGFLIFGILYYLKNKKEFQDKIFFLFISLLGLSRIIVDMFRYFESSIIMINAGGFQVSSNQIISFLLIVAGIIGIIYKSKKKS